MLTGELLDGRYRLLERAGVGGTSEVFRARDETLGRDVAIKRFSAAVDELGDEGRRHDEVQLLAGLAHPGVVTLFDAVLDADPPYLVMEYVDGPSLRDRLRAGPLGLREAREIGAAVAAGLAAIHARGVVHRDVKPENILLPASGSVSAAKLVDFGIAKAADAATITAAGTVLGTAAYLSPEQARGEPARPPSDVYSLGLVLIEALTGAKPFPGTALESAAARLQQDPDVSAPALAELRGLLAEMTRRDAETRPSAADVATALGRDTRTRVLPLTSPAAPAPDATAPMTAPVGAAGPSPAPRAGTDRVRRGLLVGAVLGIAAAAIAGIGGLSTVLLPPATGHEKAVPVEKVKTDPEPAVEPAPPSDEEPAGPPEERAGNGPPADRGPDHDQRGGNPGNGIPGNGGNPGNGNSGNGGRGPDNR